MVRGFSVLVPTVTGRTVGFSGWVVLGRLQGGGHLSCWWGALTWKWTRKVRDNERAGVANEPGEEWDRGLAKNAPPQPRPG